jgi:hypothetical protein|tara:strand:+ start:604 stop:1389 length:786 start_codon:yes stop_codon:yes gene_type:complete
MADINSLVRRIRARVHDSVAHDDRQNRPLYLDSYYHDSVYSGLGRINLDTDSNYTIDTLPAKYDYLAEVRGTINMCYVRGAEGASGDVEDFPNVPDSIVTVPQLTVQRQQMPLEGPKYWLKLAERLEEEYRNAIARLEDRGDEGAQIQQAVMTRMSLRTGRRTPYIHDKPITIPDGFAVSVSGTDVSIIWGVVYDDYFSRYLLLRSPDLGFSSSVEIYTSSDNHDEKYVDSPGVGTWYYKLGVVNSNSLYSYTAQTSVVLV